MLEYIGIDIGGTNIRIGAIDESENVIFEYKETTFNGITTDEDLYEKIKKLITKVPSYEKVKAIGIGFPGAIDMTQQNIITSNNVKLLIEFPLAKKLNEELKKPVFIENDARIATYAEALKGKGKDKDIVCYITISTGLGGGVVINKQIYRGSNNIGAYFSRMILDGKNTSDALISGTALLKQAREQIDNNIETTSELFKLEEDGNIVAREIVEEFKKNLTVLLLNISSTINPDIIILGGGVLKSKNRFLEDVINNFKEKSHKLAKKTIIEVTELKGLGIIGAALFARNKLSNG